MSFTMTRTATESFTLTWAKYLASKVTADMKRCQQLYGLPTDDQINNYGTELALLLRDGYVSEYEFGYTRDNKRVLTWRYTVDTSGSITTDDRPGRILSGVELLGADFFNYLWHSGAWQKLTPSERERIENYLPIKRVGRDAPGDGTGYWQADLAYSATGVALSRRSFRPLGV
jgi:hypothetical protein